VVGIPTNRTGIGEWMGLQDSTIMAKKLCWSQFGGLLPLLTSDGLHPVLINSTILETGLFTTITEYPRREVLK